MVGMVLPLTFGPKPGRANLSRLASPDALLVGGSGRKTSPRKMDTHRPPPAFPRIGRAALSCPGIPPRATQARSCLDVSRLRARRGERWRLVRAVLATREVFVQRFGTELRGFENVCRHRHNPLRRQERGNGPIICGFHQWQYNRDGLAIGIPKCRELYGKLPHELDARLVTLEVATCGSLVFGRFPSDQATQSLEDFLDDGFPILDALTRRATLPERMLRKDSAANWKLNLHITQDECHAFSIHTRTFIGVNPNRLPTLIKSSTAVLAFTVRTCGHLISGRSTNWSPAFRDGTYGASHYVILQIPAQSRRWPGSGQ